MPSNERVVMKTGMFGFRKKDVMTYIKGLDEKAKEQIALRDAKIQNLGAAVSTLNTKIAEHEREIISITAQRELIAQTLMSARQTAAKLVSDAHTEVAQKRADFQRTYTAEVNKLAAIRNEVIQLRKFATDAIRTFERELASLERTNIK